MSMKKRFVLGMLIVGVAMAFVACKGPVAGAPVASGEEIDVKPEEEPDIWLETEVEVVDPLPRPEDEMVELTPKEIEYFNHNFFNRQIMGDEINIPMTNMFLTSEYYTPLDINLNMLFTDGIYDVVLPKLTVEEKNLLIERYDWEFDAGEPCRLSLKNVDMVLKQYTGLTIEQTNKVGMLRYYLEEYQSYYIYCDCSYSEVDVIRGWKNAQGTVVLEYSLEGSLKNEVWQVILHEKDGQYYFVANVRIYLQDDYYDDVPEIDIVYPEIEEPVGSYE